MFHHILVPLDGSSRAEQALPLATHIARHTGSSLSLLSAVSPEVGTSTLTYATAGALANEMQTVLVKEAQHYLERIAHSDLLSGLIVHTWISTDAPAQAILHYAQEKNADLIVLCRHGSTGLKQWALGSVAQKIARHSPVPVLILSVKGIEAPLAHPEVTHPIRALVAVDGSPLAEAILLPTAQLVAAASPTGMPGELHLLRVVKPPSDPEERRYLAYDINIRQFYRNEAEHYLCSMRDRFTQELAANLNVRLSFSIRENADIATALMSVLETGDSSTSSNGYDVMAIATHGRGGLKRWMVGSIAERILEKEQLPLLIMRPQAQ
jgi:nucleotide-binding universal stress UspA family protein